MNILNIIREQISPETLGQISKSVGESPEGARSALDQALPALLGSAVSQAASPQGAPNLFNSITRELPKLGSLSSILSSLGGPGGGGPGASFVSSLLGPKMNMVRDLITSRAGIGSNSGTSLLGFAGSLLMGALGKQMATQKLDAGGFGQLLRSQVPHLQGLLSPDLTKMLGLGNLGNLVGTSPPAPEPSYTASPASHAAVAPSSGAKALKWALIPLALLLVCVFLYRNSGNTNKGGTKDETYSTADRVTSASYVDTTSFTGLFKDALTNPTGTPLDLQGISYDSLGSLSTDATTKLSALGKLINEYPYLKVSITAYGKTDADAALKAKAIKSALAKAGVSADRVTTETAVGEAWPKISFGR